MVQTLLKKVMSIERIEREFKSNALADLKRLEAGLAPRRPKLSGLTEAAHQKILSRIRDSFIHAKREQLSRDPSYQTTGEWVPIVNKVRSNYLEAVQSASMESFGELLQSFFRNSGSAGLNTHESYESAVRLNLRGQKEFTLKMLQDLSLWKDLTESADFTPLSSPDTGNPWGYFIQDTLILPNACRHHYSAWRVKQLLQNSQTPVVAEIGGGYGGFAYFLSRELPGAKYINFDLPEVLMIAQYYLLRAFPEKRILLFGESRAPLSGESIRSHDLILMPNIAISDLPDRSVDLFFNTNGLSEMNEATVREYFKHIHRTTRKYFYHVNSDVPVIVGAGHREIPASRFPISPEFTLLAKHYSPFGGSGGRDKEFLYEFRASQEKGPSP